MVFNAPQIHMFFNHLPVIGFVFIPVLLLIAMFIRSVDIKRFVLLVTMAVGLTALPAFFTGEPAEEMVEHMPGFDEKLIHEHEEAGEFAMILSIVTAVAAGGAFVLHRHKPESLKKTLPAVFVLSLLTGVSMGKTAHEGGKIRHSEIREDAQASH